MAKAATKAEELASRKEAQIDHAIRTAVIAMVLSDPKNAGRVLELPPAELGRRLKSHLWAVSGIITVYRYDLPALREEGENLRERAEQLLTSDAGAAGVMSRTEKANPERYPLILERRVLPEEDFCKATHITKKQLEKDLAAGRVFSVDFGREPYYPAFFVTNLFYRKDFAKVFRRLEGLPAWSAWDFLTSPIESQDGSTPLQLLMVESIEQAVRAADDFVNQMRPALPTKRSRK
jgi:hypothetical protein